MIHITLLIAAAILAFPAVIAEKADLIVTSSFYFVTPLLIFMLWKVMFSKRTGIAFATTFVFFLLFFYVAPILQIGNNQDFLLNTLPIRNQQVLLVNGMTSAFLAAYIAFYFRTSPRKPITLIKISEDRLQSIFPILAACSMAIAAWGLSGINLLELIIREPSGDQDLMGILVKHKVIFLLPFLVASIYFVKNNGNTRLLIVLALLLMVMVTKNPFYDRRNSLGPIYLTLLCIALPYLVSTTRRFFLFLFTTLVIAFPASSIFTHHPPTDWAEVLTSNLLFEEISGHFVNMHYDAWANFVGTVDYVEKMGYQMGGQIAGSLLFYAPRSLWPNKPVSSGQALGEYLSQNYQLWFENISCPLPAEGYIDFGVIGVVFFAIGLAWYTRRLDLLLGSSNTINKISAIYFSLFLLFVLRGSLLPAVAYGVGAYLAITAAPYLLSYLLPSRWIGTTKTKTAT